MGGDENSERERTVSVYNQNESNDTTEGGVEYYYNWKRTSEIEY